MGYFSNNYLTEKQEQVIRSELEYNYGILEIPTLKIKPCYGDWFCIKKYIYETVCCYDDEIYTELMNTLARWVQNPFSTTKVIILRTLHLDSHNILVQIIEKIFDGYFTTLDKLSVRCRLKNKKKPFSFVALMPSNLLCIRWADREVMHLHGDYYHTHVVASKYAIVFRNFTKIIVTIPQQWPNEFYFRENHRVYVQENPILIPSEQYEQMRSECLSDDCVRAFIWHLLSTDLTDFWIRSY